MKNKIRTVAVVDDGDDTAQAMINVLEDGDFEAYRQAASSSLEALVEEIVNKSDAAVCDHRLRYGGFGDLSGADLAARLTKRKHPTILVTQYLDQEADVAIRKFRSDLPVVLRRGQADEPEEIRDAFARCITEIDRGRRDGRTVQRTLLQVLSISSVNGEKVIDAIVDGFDSTDAVRFPLQLVAESERDKVKEGTLLVADTNVRATEKVELFFENVGIAEEPDPNDGLA
ncbi:hypothetical protein [Xanthomonas arboricola]|uniref:hypothetical protein n=1 Tax=Xanthomonas arboricola TaxID=56448 RepID=UPI0012D3361A|nr:hypothetical protein [Xanthomonas arboricola]